jgi:hypothetical protein
MRMETVKRNEAPIQKLHDEFARFQNTMQELYLLRRVANDLKSYRRMIKLKKYD